MNYSHLWYQILTGMILTVLIMMYNPCHTEAQYRVENEVVANGGARVGNGTYIVHGTVGQTLIMERENESYSMRQGFWRVIRSEDFVTGIRNESRYFNRYPDRVQLKQNYPNPFNPVTTIVYILPRDSNVRIDVYDIAGKRVTTLIDGHQVTGRHHIHWRGRASDGSQVSSGVYWYRLVTENSTITRKMVFMK